MHDIREFYADSRIDGGIWNSNNFFYKAIYNYFKRKEKEEIENCDGIVCLTRAAERIIKDWPEYQEQIPLEVIPCSVDLDLFNPGKINPGTKKALREDLNIKDNDFVISYLGSIGGWYLTDEMMKFCKMLSDKIPDSRFLFITPHQHKIIFETAGKFGIPHEKIIVKHAQRLEVPLFLSLSNYSIFFIKPCYSKQSSSPTKHGEIMAMGIPVITNSGVGDVAEILKKYNSGFIVDDFSDSVYDSIIDSMLFSKVFNKDEIKRGAEEVYSLEKAVDSYKKIYDLVLADLT